MTQLTSVACPSGRCH